MKFYEFLSENSEITAAIIAASIVFVSMLVSNRHAINLMKLNIKNDRENRFHDQKVESYSRFLSSAFSLQIYLNADADFPMELINTLSNELSTIRIIGSNEVWTSAKAVKFGFDLIGGMKIAQQKIDKTVSGASDNKLMLSRKTRQQIDDLVVSIRADLKTPE